MRLYEKAVELAFNAAGGRVKRKELADAFLLCETTLEYAVKFFKMVYVYDLLTFKETGKRAFSWSYRVGSHCPISTELIECMVPGKGKLTDCSGAFVFSGPKGSKFSVRNAHRFKVRRLFDPPVDWLAKYVQPEAEAARRVEMVEKLGKCSPSVIDEHAYFWKSFYRSALTAGLEGKELPMERVLEEVSERYGLKR
jgi:hypothetical protein